MSTHRKQQKLTQFAQKVETPLRGLVQNFDQLRQARRFYEAWDLGNYLSTLKETHAITGVDQAANTFTLDGVTDVESAGQIVVSGSTGNDGKYTVAAVDSTALTVTVEEAIPDPTADGTATTDPFATSGRATLRVSEIEETLGAMHDVEAEFVDSTLTPKYTPEERNTFINRFAS